MATKRMIDPERYETILQRFADHLTESGKLEAAEAVRTLIKGLKIAPTVDAVEVVRCFCCKEWVEIEDTIGAGYCHHPCWLLVGYEPPIVQGADFCSYGERRTDA